MRSDGGGRISRRQFIEAGAMAAGATAAVRLGGRLAYGAEATPIAPLAEFGYGDVTLKSELHEGRMAVLFGNAAAGGGGLSYLCVFSADRTRCM